MPLGDMYAFSCGVCTRALLKDSKVLLCGHIQCNDCTSVYSNDKIAKCAKCSATCLLQEICKPSLGVTAMLLHHPCKCSVCKKTGSQENLIGHSCNSKDKYKALTIAEVLTHQSKTVQQAAYKVSTTWVPKLSVNGTFVAKTASGRVSK
jgi:hypothetical protein